LGILGDKNKKIINPQVLLQKSIKEASTLSDTSSTLNMQKYYTLQNHIEEKSQRALESIKKFDPADTKFN
jgi:hypothetical protein